MNYLIRNIDNYLLKKNSLNGFKLDKLLVFSDKLVFKQANFGTYNRTVFHTCKKYEIIIINWGLNASTNIHNHPHSTSIVHLLNGKLKEDLYDKDLKKINTKILINRETSYISNSNNYHKVSNLDKHSISLHIYSPPL